MKPIDQVSNAPGSNDGRGSGRLLIVVTLAAVALHACGLWRPLIDRHDWGSAHQAQFGRNHVRYGLAETKGRCVYSLFQRRLPEARHFYPDHPPLLSLSLAASMAVFGVNDVAVRLVPALSTVIAIVLTTSIAIGLFGRRVGLFSGVVMLALPIFTYFGRTACHETLVLPFCLLAMRGYLGWTYVGRFPGGSRLNAFVFALGTMLSILTGWVAFIQAGVVAIHFTVCVWRRERSGRHSGWLLVTLPALFAATLTALHILWTLNWQIGHLYELFAYRSGIKKSEKLLTTEVWLVQQGIWLIRNFTSTGLVVVVAGMMLEVLGKLREPTQNRRRPAGGRRRAGRRMTVTELPTGIGISKVMSRFWLLGSTGLLFVIIFRSASLLHEYWWIHFAPFFAMLAGEAVARIDLKISRWSRGLAAIFSCLVLVGIAVEGAAEKSIFHHRRRLPAAAYEACQYIADHAPADAIIYGNRKLWATRSYYEGAVQFLHPQFCWYMDRMYYYVASDQGLRGIAPQCEYYLWVGFDEKNRRLAERLGEMGEVVRRWPNAIIFDLTGKSRRGERGN
ncbi:MAG: glycosyltransferase family 39 protein [Planctomycetia bacterium]|jgi:hypothetical protein|nr:glycosyltransferase family 39 protein [Planctomycetia bacterium]OQZ05585.1 MAG: hypothetical protein B6D36_09390 [Planctomycetes bacterium UTPLA1]